MDRILQTGNDRPFTPEIYLVYTACNTCACQNQDGAPLLASMIDRVYCKAFFTTLFDNRLAKSFDPAVH
jgi:hypothetical protein